MTHLEFSLNPNFLPTALLRASPGFAVDLTLMNCHRPAWPVTSVDPIANANCPAAHPLVFAPVDPIPEEFPPFLVCISGYESRVNIMPLTGT